MSNVASEWMGRDVKQVKGDAAQLGRMGVVVEVFDDKEGVYYARLVNEEDGREWTCAICLLAPLYVRVNHVKFVAECRRAGMKVRFYEGRNFYKGPAVIQDTYQSVISKVSMPLQWDRLGHDFIIYPR